MLSVKSQTCPLNRWGRWGTVHSWGGCEERGASVSKPEEVPRLRPHKDSAPLLLEPGHLLLSWGFVRGLPRTYGVGGTGGCGLTLVASR